MTDIYTQASQMMHLKNRRLEAVIWYLHQERGCAFPDLSVSSVSPTSWRVYGECLLAETLRYKELPVYKVSWSQRAGEDYIYDCVQEWVDNPHLSHYCETKEPT